jgi:uncharacterized membrane protein
MEKRERGKEAERESRKWVVMFSAADLVVIGSLLCSNAVLCDGRASSILQDVCIDRKVKSEGRRGWREMTEGRW